jgi:hypothetical protein
LSHQPQRAGNSIRLSAALNNLPDPRPPIIHQQEERVIGQSSTSPVHAAIPVSGENTDDTHISLPFAQPYHHGFGTLDTETWLPGAASHGSRPLQPNSFPNRRYSGISLQQSPSEPEYTFYEGDGATTRLSKHGHPEEDRSYAHSHPLSLTDDECKLVKHFFTVLMPWVGNISPSSPRPH